MRLPNLVYPSPVADASFTHTLAASPVLWSHTMPVQARPYVVDFENLLDEEESLTNT